LRVKRVVIHLGLRQFDFGEAEMRRAVGIRMILRRNIVSCRAGQGRDQCAGYWRWLAGLRREDGRRPARNWRPWIRDDEGEGWAIASMNMARGLIQCQNPAGRRRRCRWSRAKQQEALRQLVEAGPIGEAWPWSPGDEWTCRCPGPKFGVDCRSGIGRPAELKRSWLLAYQRPHRCTPPGWQAIAALKNFPPALVQMVVN